MNENDIEKTYEKLGIPVGDGERAFWNYEYKNEKDVPGLYKGKFCTGFPDINKKNIVKGESSQADCIVPNNYFIRKHGITFFSKFNLKSEEQKNLLTDMVEMALNHSNPDDVIMFFNVLRRKVTRGDKDHCMIMTVSYLHLWVVQKSKMRNTDEIFHQNMIIDKKSKLFSEKEVIEIKKHISKMIQRFDNSLILENINSKCFAPIHIQVFGKGKNDVEKIVDSLVKTSKIIKEIDANPLSRKFIDKGFRIMIRKDDEWSSNILGGGKLSTISKTSD